MVMEIPPPLSVEDYLKVAGDLTDVQVCKFETLEPAFAVRIPRIITLLSLSDFLRRLGVECDPDTQKLLIFKARERKRLPDFEPLKVMPSNTEILFYLVASAHLALSAQTVIAVFSEDGYRKTASRALFLVKRFSAERIKESVAELIPENKQIRILSIKDHEIDRIYAPKERFTDFDPDKQLVRIEVIPDDQIGVPEKDLVRVVQVDVDSIGYFKPVAFPFFLNCPADATVENVREMIKERLKIADDIIARYRFVALGRTLTAKITTEKLELDTVLKRDQRIRDCGVRENLRLLMVRPGDRRKGRTSPGSVVLKN
jgi:hypothetical protein